MIRAFIGVSLDPQVCARIAEAMAPLAGKIAGVRWVPQNNFHFTIKFLGAIEETQIEPLCDALNEVVRPFRRFTVHAKRLGVFPGLKRARVLWVGIDGNELPALAQAVENVLEPFGFPRENRLLQPHLTVGRWRDFAGPRSGLEELLERSGNVNFGSSIVEGMTFFQSTLKPHGAEYRPLREVRFGND